MNLPSPKAIDTVPIHDYSLADQIAQTPAYGTILLKNGTYPIKCDGTVIIKEGVTIRGEGRKTIIQRDDHWPANNQPVLKGSGDNITLENFTWDANAPDKDLCDYAYGGIHLYGLNNRIVNVHGIRPTGNYARGAEGWSFWMITGADMPSGLVRDCSISDPRGDYVNGFSASGASTFENCRIDAPMPTGPDGPHFNGFQGAGRSRFINCIQNGGRTFFSTDTESVAPIFRGCLGVGLVHGVWVVVKPGQVSDGLTVDGCEFQLVPNLAGDRYGVAVSGEGQIRNVRVVNSVFRYAPGNVAETPGAKYAAAVTGASAQGTVFQGNMVDSDFYWFSANSAIINGNTTIARAPIAPSP